MISVFEARRRVNQGARFLDVVRPNWFEKIDIYKLRLESCTECIAAQLSSWRTSFLGPDVLSQSFERGLIELGIVSENYSLSDAEVAAEYGLCLKMGDVELRTKDCVGNSFQVLQDMWIEAIAERIAKEEEMCQSSTLVMVST